jgi:DNA-3-methyladenine glycosylase
MFGPIGHAYVYINYGIHYGFNVVARDENFPAGGVLIRAVEPLEGIEVMKKNRHSASDASLKNLTNGPGKLTQAFGITKVDDHLDLLTSSKIFLAKNSIYPHENYTIEKSSRIGISKAREYLWRFYIKKLS